jgi:quinol monooxygenase YgiN
LKAIATCSWHTRCACHLQEEPAGGSEEQPRLPLQFSAQPGRCDDLVNYLLPAATALERNSGCIHYIVSASDEPETKWVWEVWTNVAAHDPALEPEGVLSLIQEARPLIAGISGQTQLTAQGSKGLPGCRLPP